jgi:CBS domain-containing protein
MAVRAPRLARFLQLNLNQSRGDRIMPTPLEREREKIMEKQSPDLPFGKQKQTATGWGIIGAVLLAGFAIPLFYVALSLYGAVATSTAGLWIATLLLIVGIIGVVAVAFFAVRKKGEEYENAQRKERQGIGQKSYESGELFGVMSRNPVGCGVIDSLGDAAKNMYQHNVGFLIIHDERDNFVGVLTDRDITIGGIANGFDPVTTPVGVLIERKFYSVGPEAKLSEVVSLMSEQGIRRVPVVDHGHCLGIISVDDLIVKEVCTVSELAPIFRKQLSEPNMQHGVRVDEDRAA